MIIKAAIAVFSVASLVYSSTVWSATHSSPRHANRPSELARVLSEARAAVREKTAVPLRVPTHIAAFDRVGAEDIYAIIESADETGYSIILGADPDCKGQHQCSYGTLIGTTRPLIEIDDYDVVHRRGASIALANGLKGRFFDTVCGAYCSDSLIVWTEGRYHYIIGLKAEKRSSLIKVANSAIRAGLGRRR